MADIRCGYAGDRDETLIAYLYNDIDPATRAGFEAHLAGCDQCRDEITTLRGVRVSLARWNPPEPKSELNRPSPVGAERWWRAVPAWAQVAAALLFVGVAAAIANLDVRYDANGLTVRTGWARSATPATSPSAAQAPTSAPAFVSASDLAAVEGRLRAELRTVQHATATTTSRPSYETELLRKVRALIDEAERRQQRELALRLAQAITDVNAARQADLRRVDSSLNRVENSLGVEVLKNRQDMRGILMRVNQRQ